MAETSKRAASRPEHPAVQGADSPQAGKDDQNVPGTSGEVNGRLRTAEPAGSGDQGPGTKQERPDEDQLQRGQARMHIGNAGAAAPIEAPDAAKQTQPVAGHDHSSHNPVAATAGLQTIAGENHARFVDEDGQDIGVGDLFEASQENQTFRVVKRRVYEEFNYSNSQQPMTRLLYPAGHRLDLVTASQLEHAQQLGQQQREQYTERAEAASKAFHGAN